MAPITTITEIARPAADVFAYVTASEVPENMKRLKQQLEARP